MRRGQIGACENAARPLRRHNRSVRLLHTCTHTHGFTGRISSAPRSVWKSPLCSCILDTLKPHVKAMPGRTEVGPTCLRPSELTSGNPALRQLEDLLRQPCSVHASRRPSSHSASAITATHRRDRPPTTACSVRPDLAMVKLARNDCSGSSQFSPRRRPSRAALSAVALVARHSHKGGPRTAHSQNGQSSLKVSAICGAGDLSPKFYSLKAQSLSREVGAEGGT